MCYINEVHKNSEDLEFNKTSSKSEFKKYYDNLFKIIIKNDQYFYNFIREIARIINFNQINYILTLKL